MKRQPKQAFTLIELLTVIAIIGILASILIPTVGRVRESARRTVDASNLRQIGQSSLIFANDNREMLPMRGGPQNRYIDQFGQVQTGNTNTAQIHHLAAALARQGGLNDGSMWVSASDNSTTPAANRNLGIIYNRTNNQVDQDFLASALSFAYVAGLNTSMASTTPIAYTRGLHDQQGRWTPSPTGVYGTDGGHIVFLGGNVRFFRDLGPSETEGSLVRTDGERTMRPRLTIRNTQAIYSTPAASSSAVAGNPGAGT